MDNYRLTTERLRSYLGNSQEAKERLCCLVLDATSHFSRVLPRNPRGGKDGGIDLEARGKDGKSYVGAVHFYNDAKNDVTQSRNTIKKFESDCYTSYSYRASHGFVFMTNANIPAKQKDRLKSIAISCGYKECLIFDNEDISSILNTPNGMHIRLEFLKIQMSTEEMIGYLANRDIQNYSKISEMISYASRSIDALRFEFKLSRSPVNCVLNIRFKKSVADTKVSECTKACIGFFMIADNAKDLFSAKQYAGFYSRNEDNELVFNDMLISVYPNNDSSNGSHREVMIGQRDLHISDSGYTPSCATSSGFTPNTSSISIPIVDHLFYVGNRERSASMLDLQNSRFELGVSEYFLDKIESINITFNSNLIYLILAKDISYEKLSYVKLDGKLSAQEFNDTIGCTHRLCIEDNGVLSNFVINFEDMYI